MFHRTPILILGIVAAFVQVGAAATNMYEADVDVRVELLPVYAECGGRDSASIDSLIRYRMAENHIPGMATLALKDGQIVWNQCYGYAILEDSVPVADSTLFYMASISKTFVGAALMQLWEEGLVGLDDDVSMHLGFPVRNPLYPDSVISVRMCMTHMSSINDNFDILDPLNIQGDSPVPLGEFLEEYLVPGGIYYSPNNYNPWPPASEDDYCNIGAAICGYIVEQHADSFPVRCRDSVFTPLQMNETAWFLSDLDTGNIAMPYHWDGVDQIPYGHIGKPYYPCGTLRTSSLQLARHLEAFMRYGRIDDTTRILDSTTVVLMTTSQYPVLNPEQGLFWYKKFLDGRWIWGHQGWSHGARTRIAFDWNNNTGAIVLTNGEDINSVTEIMLNLLNYAGQYGITEAEESALRPLVVLGQNYPNPFSTATNIRFALHEASDVTLTVYNVIGQEVRVLIDGELAEGEHSLVWQPNGLPSGVYYYRLVSGNQNWTRRCVLLN